MNRVLTALSLLAVAFYLVFFAPAPVFLAAAMFTGFLCYREYSTIAAGHGIRRPDWTGITLGLFLLLLPQYALPAAVLLLMLTVIIALRLDNLKEVLPHAAATVFGAVYTFAPWRFAIDLRQQSVHLLFFALALNWAGDSLAYYVGRSVGKHRLAPVVSPKKSWEGATAAVVGAVLFSITYLHFFVPQLAWWKIAIIATAANIAGQFGDLAESALKRGAGVKDSGTLLPGHGGVLDRLDSSLFALPVVYILLLLLHIQ